MDAQAGDLAGVGKRQKLDGAAGDLDRVQLAVGCGVLAVVGKAFFRTEMFGEPV